MPLRRSTYALRAALLVLLIGTGPLSLVHAQPSDLSRAAAVKAAYVINFLRYTHWPEPRRPFTVTVLGADSIATALEAVSREPVVVANGGLVVNRLRYPRPGADGAFGSEQRARFAQALQESHLVFIGADDVDRVPDILELVRATPVLTVSDVEGFADGGGMLELVVAGRRIAFDANPDAIESGGLAMSAKVLKLARDLHGVRH